MNQAGIDLLKHFESFRTSAYLDMVGVPTIGWGFTKGVKLGDLMTRAEAETRLQEEIAHFEAGLGCEGNANQLAALTCLAYNIGLGNFGASTVKREHLAGNNINAANAFRMWNKAKGKVVPGLIRRREQERSLYMGLQNEAHDVT